MANRRFWVKLFVHSLQANLVCLAIFGLAVGMTYFDDWCHHTNRPEWLVQSFKTLSIFVYAVDGIVFCAHLLFTAWRALYHLFYHE